MFLPQKRGATSGNIAIESNIIANGIRRYGSMLCIETWYIKIIAVCYTARGNFRYTAEHSMPRARTLSAIFSNSSREIFSIVLQGVARSIE